VATLQLEAAPPTSISPPLRVVTALCRGLAETGVVYCHWKSNEHLRAGTLGETDLDILVDRESAAEAARVLAETGYKRMLAVPARSYVGIEDYLALDQATGRLVHLHLHYRLVLGEKFLKGYRLPWEDRLLAGRQLDQETGVYVSPPELELIVLVTRAALKLRRRETLGFGGPGPLDADFLREFRWLAERVDTDRLRSQATELLGVSAALRLAAMLQAPPDRAAVSRFRREIAPVTDAWRTYPASEATRRRWAREARARSAKLWSRISGSPPIIRFSNPRGGVIIAFLGADGSGKSTVTGAVDAWLSWRVEVVRLYFGFGDGPVSPIRKPLQALKSLYSRRRSRAVTRTQPSSVYPGEETASRPSWLALPKVIWRILWSWSVVREKQTRLARAQRGRNLGLAVIGDRYPQAQIMALGDGPLLSHWEKHPWAWLRAVARWELAEYRSMEAVAPDLVIKLHVTPEVSARRKRDVSLDSLVSRVDVVKRVQFPERTRVAQVDADQPIEQVLLEVKRAIWEAL
jgi:thymidylate kinase